MCEMCEMRGGGGGGFIRMVIPSKAGNEVHALATNARCPEATCIFEMLSNVLRKVPK